MSPTRIIPARELEVGEFFATAESALRITSVTPIEHGMFALLEDGTEITFPDNAEVLIRDGAVR